MCDKCDIRNVFALEVARCWSKSCLLAYFSIRIYLQDQFICSNLEALTFLLWGTYSYMSPPSIYTLWAWVLPCTIFNEHRYF